MREPTTTPGGSSDPIFKAHETPAARPSGVHKPLMTALLLASGTLCISGVVATILPASAGSAVNLGPAPLPVAAVVRAPARQVDTASAPGVVPVPQSEPVAAAADAEVMPVLPRAIERLAVTAAEAVAHVERRLDQRAQAEAEPAAAVTYASPAYGAAQAPPTAPMAASSRVVYLVDASGSLLDSLPQVIEWLGESLDALGSGQQFTVLFFREGQVFEAPPRGLKPASFPAKASVWTWIQPETGNVAPKGRSDLLGAVEVAMGYRPDELYVVSDDSFNRSAAGSRSDDGAILQRIKARLGRTPPKVHTVQFFYRDEAGALEAIADRFGGTYQFIEPVERNTSAATDPLIELSIVN